MNVLEIKGGRMRGPCAKAVVTCTIKTKSGHFYIGDNSCLSPQETCPRVKGEGYEKCKTICKQECHAEISALNCALEDGANLKDAVAIVHGIGHSCKNCQKALYGVGVAWIGVRNE